MTTETNTANMMDRLNVVNAKDEVASSQKKETQSHHSDLLKLAIFAALVFGVATDAQKKETQEIVVAAVAAVAATMDTSKDENAKKEQNKMSAIASWKEHYNAIRQANEK